MAILDISGGFNATTLLVFGIGAVIGWFLVSTFTAWYRLRHVPGPWLASFSSLWIARYIYQGRTKQGLESLAQYGRLVRLSPQYLVTDDPDILRYVAAARGLYNRDKWWDTLKLAGDDNSLTILEARPHDKFKAKVAAGYSGREDMDMEEQVGAKILHFKAMLRRRYLSTEKELKAVDLAHLTLYFTLDVITQLVFGKAFGFMDAEDDLYAYSTTMDALGFPITIAAEVPWLRRLSMSFLGASFRPKMSDKTGLGKAMNVGREIIEARYESGNDKNGDMLSSFMRHGVPRETAIAEVPTQLIAGSETSSTVIRSTMIHLMMTPRAYQRLKKEIKDAVDSGAASSPITLAEAKKLPYLQAVIAEGIRIRPPAPFGHYKSVPPGGDFINGMFIPEGTAIGHNSCAMMRRADIFGQDVEIFRPERFLECSSEQRLEMDRTIDVHFGAGRWQCAGKQLAHTELNKMYFELFRDFDFQVVNPLQPFKERAYSIWRQEKMIIRVSEAMWT